MGWGSLIILQCICFSLMLVVQGTGRLFRGIKTSKKIRVMTAAMFIGGFLNGILSQLWGDGDDDNYDKYIPDYKKNTRIVFF